MCPFLLCLSAELSPSLIGILHVSSFNLCAMRADVPILQMREQELTEVKWLAKGHTGRVRACQSPKCIFFPLSGNHFRDDYLSLKINIHMEVRISFSQLWKH